MDLKRIGNLVRSNRVFSWAATRSLYPVQRGSRTIEREIRKKIWLNGGRVRYDGIVLQFPPNVGVSYASLIFWNGLEGYEPHTWRALKPLLGNAKRFLDVGSNIGLYAVLARKLNSKLMVDAFEPVPALYQKNVEFHRANGIEPTGLWECALSDADGEATLYLPIEPTQLEEETTGTLRAESWQARQEQRREHRVKTVKLDTWMQGREIVPTVIKMDVEDHEAAALKGGQETLLRQRPILVCEILPRAHGNAETLALLREVGYASLAISSEGLFRMGEEDFSKTRRFTNFVLMPVERMNGQSNYFAYDELNGI